MNGMTWLGGPLGLFRLHDSDRYCGSYFLVEDAAEVLGMPRSALDGLPQEELGGVMVVSETVLRREWQSRRVASPHEPTTGGAKRSLDELIVMRLAQVALPGCSVEPQVPFGRKHVDIRVEWHGVPKFVEFVGPSHFIVSLGRTPSSPLARKQEVEDHFGYECVIWPYWIQRCASNVLTMFDGSVTGLASVWSTKAHFGDFVYQRSADLILAISNRFNAVRSDGLGYMYGSEHTDKPVHPIIAAIKRGEQGRERLVPRGSAQPVEFWLPKELRE